MRSDEEIMIEMRDAIGDERQSEVLQMLQIEVLLDIREYLKRISPKDYVVANVLLR